MADIIPDPTNDDVGIAPNGKLATAIRWLPSTGRPPTAAELDGGVRIGWAFCVDEDET